MKEVKLFNYKRRGGGSGYMAQFITKWSTAELGRQQDSKAFRIKFL